MDMSGSDCDAASDEKGYAAQDNLYEISSNSLEARTHRSTVLLIYDGHIVGTTQWAIIDSGASTLYVSQRILQELGLQTTKIEASYVKVGKLPADSLTAHVFPDDEGYESSNMHGDEYEDEYRDPEPSTHNLMMSQQQHRKEHGQVLRYGKGGERQRRRERGR
jgi:uncharacterized protein YtpQ (UPF0354 family)